MAGQGQPPMRVTFESDGLTLVGHVAQPPASATVARGPRGGVVLCHGFPAERGGARTTAQTYPEFAERLANEAGWVVLSFNFRGTGESEGDFSLGGWLADLRAAIAFLRASQPVDGVWLVGFSAGGALALCAAAEDATIGGVAALAAPADFNRWTDDPAEFLARCREVGVVRTPGFPDDLTSWALEMKDVRPATDIAGVPPRPVLLVHGSADELVPVTDARALADATDGAAELRVVSDAGHRLRHDPRAVAVLLGWLERQHV